MTKEKIEQFRLIHTQLWDILTEELGDCTLAEEWIEEFLYSPDLDETFEQYTKRVSENDN